MNISKFAIMSMAKSSLKWIFFCILYPYVVMSMVYGEGVSIAGLLFSYIAIVPTLLAIKSMRVARERSIDLNEFLVNFSKTKFDDEVYERIVIGLKISRKVLLVMLGMLFIKVLFMIFNISSFVSPSLNAFLIVLLQLYYIAIVMARIKYEV